MIQIIPEAVQRKPFVGSVTNAHGRKQDTYGSLETWFVGIDRGATSDDPSAQAPTTTTGQATLYIGPDQVSRLNDSDRWVVGGNEYYTDGFVTPIRNMFTGDQFYVEVTIRRVKG